MVSWSTFFAILAEDDGCVWQGDAVEAAGKEQLADDLPWRITKFTLSKPTKRGDRQRFTYKLWLAHASTDENRKVQANLSAEQYHAVSTGNLDAVLEKVRTSLGAKVEEVNALVTCTSNFPP